MALRAPQAQRDGGRTAPDLRKAALALWSSKNQLAKLRSVSAANRRQLRLMELRRGLLAEAVVRDVEVIQLGDLDSVAAHHLAL